MTKKTRGKLAVILAFILLGITVLPNTVVAADVPTENIANDNEESLEVDDNVLTETEQVEQSVEQQVEEERRTDEGNQEDIVTDVPGLINYVGVESPYLETPNEQQIVVSFGDGNENISTAKLVCQKTDDSLFEFELDKRENELYLFKQTFEASEAGVYQLISFSYVQDGVETSVDLAEIGIKAMFGVDEYYPGCEEMDESEITAEDVEMSVVNVDSDDVESVENDIEEAIEITAEDIEDNIADAVESENIISKKAEDLLSSFADIIMPATTAKAAENVVVVLDPGHGGSDVGAVGNDLQESALTLKIAQYCKAELEKYNGVTVYMTRNSDVYVGLTERVQMAKAWGADVFVSIHINSATATANGAEVWYPNSSYNSTIHSQGAALSNAILEQLVSLGLANRGIKIRNSENGTKYADGSIADYYSVIRDSKANGFPGIIVEHAFISNPSDAAKLAQDSFLKQLGVADATGIANYFGLVKGPSVQITNKNDFSGTAQINVTGLGNNASVKVWNEDTNQSKTYSVASGKSTVEFNVNEFGGARGTYYLETFNASGTSLYKTSFYVSKDTSSVISVESDGMDKQWIVNISFADMPSEVTSVQVPVWCALDQSDIIWYNAKQTSTGNWQATVNFSDYKKFGSYKVHVYAGLSNGDLQLIGTSAFSVTTPTLTVSSGNYNSVEGTFDVIIKDIVSTSGVGRIQVPVWCASDQSDIVWYDAVKQDDGSYKVTVSMSNHNYATGEYKIHAYLTTGNGVVVFAGAAPSVNVILPNMEISATDTKGTETEYTLKVTNPGLLGVIRNVQFATWSAEGGQDDIIWYNGTKNAAGDWTVTANVKKHKSTGTYNVHVYATLADGSVKFLGTTTFEVTTPTLMVDCENYNPEEGTFDVVIKDVVSKSGVSKIQVPVWCASNQSDIIWYDAVKQDDGSYKVTVSMSNHNYATGEYKIHTYLTAGNGVFVFTGAAPSVNVILPNMEISATDTKGTETEYTLKVTNPGLLGVIRNVQFATWSAEGGQDDIIWYNGTKNAAGDWTVTANVKKHKSTGTYNVHVYATLADGSVKFLGTTTFEVTCPSINGITVSEYDENSGMFKVIVSGVNAPSGVLKVQVPVWCAEDQNDIRWYDAEEQDDGSYVVCVDPMYHKYNSGLYRIHVYVTTKTGITAFVGSSSQCVSATQCYTIMGENTVTIEQMMSYYESSGHTYPSLQLGAGGASSLEAFCQLYYEEAAAEGVRVEVAFAQAMKETGWLQYGGIVQIEQFNFAGIGAVDGNSIGNCATFPDVRTGIRAQIQHLKAYASTDTLQQECVDPRFHLVTRGSAPYVEWLGQKENPNGYGWATAEGYGTSIVDMIKVLKNL